MKNDESILKSGPITLLCYFFSHVCPAQLTDAHIKHEQITKFQILAQCVAVAKSFSSGTNFVFVSLF